MRLVPATDAYFAWMLDEAPSPADVVLPEGGIAEDFVIRHVRKIAASQRDVGYAGSWLIVDGNEVVGMCGHHAPPAEGTIEIGYNVAPARQRRGYATRAIALLIEDAAARADIETIFAHTALDNSASQRVLERNEFESLGERISDGEPVIRWARSALRKTD
jgi:RimJ/RimL family protein N-acetyltransferase